MAQYKVPQAVEAEDKLLGPFTFRQFVYLLIAAGCIAAAWGLFQLFPLLAIIPLPFVAFFLVLALPVKKDQPMEVYLAAVVNYYIKPNHRVWTPGQRESTILITAPKHQEKSRVRNLSESEASSRLSFLANIVDTEGYAIRGDAASAEFAGSSVKDEYLAEANQVNDIMDNQNTVIDKMIQNEQNARHEEIVNEMRTALNRTESLAQPQPTVNTPAPQPVQAPIRAQIQNLANNNAFSISTKAQQANRIVQKATPITPQPTPIVAPQPIYQPQYIQPAMQQPAYNPAPQYYQQVPPVYQQNQVPQQQPQPSSQPYQQFQQPAVQPVHQAPQPSQSQTTTPINLYQGPGPIF